MHIARHIQTLDCAQSWLAGASTMVAIPGSKSNEIKFIALILGQFSSLEDNHSATEYAMNYTLKFPTHQRQPRAMHAVDSMEVTIG